jgi:hypothetical protein
LGKEAGGAEIEQSCEMIDAASEFTFRTCIRTAWLVVRDHWFPLVSAAFLRELLATLAAGLVFAVFVDWKGWNLILVLVVRCLAWSALQCGYLKFCLNVCENNKVCWNDLFSGLNSSLKMAIATACLWCAVVVGLVLLVVPGLFFAVRFSLYGFSLVDQNLSALRSLLMSHRMLKGFSWSAARFLLIYCVGVGILGWLSFAFESLLAISLCMLYKHIRAQEASQ